MERSRIEFKIAMGKPTRNQRKRSASTKNMLSQRALLSCHRRTKQKSKHNAAHNTRHAYSWQLHFLISAEQHHGFHLRPHAVWFINYKHKWRQGHGSWMALTWFTSAARILTAAAILTLNKLYWWHPHSSGRQHDSWHTAWIEFTHGANIKIYVASIA